MTSPVDELDRYFTPEIIGVIGLYVDVYGLEDLENETRTIKKEYNEQCQQLRRIYNTKLRALRVTHKILIGRKEKDNQRQREKSARAYLNSNESIIDYKSAFRRAEALYVLKKYQERKVIISLLKQFVTGELKDLRNYMEKKFPDNIRAIMIYNNPIEQFLVYIKIPNGQEPIRRRIHKQLKPEAQNRTIKDKTYTLDDISYSNYSSIHTDNKLIIRCPLGEILLGLKYLKTVVDLSKIAISLNIRDRRWDIKGGIHSILDHRL